MVTNAERDKIQKKYETYKTPHDDMVKLYIKKCSEYQGKLNESRDPVQIELNQERLTSARDSLDYWKNKVMDCWKDNGVKK